MQGITQLTYPRENLKTGVDVVSFLADSGSFPSKGEARKTIQGGGVSVNRKKVEDIQFRVDESLLLHDQFVLIQKGKKHHYLVRVV
jgi:tyrosyl-tRNA synthetase